MLPDSKTLIANVYRACKKEADRNKPLYSFDKFLRRAASMLGIDRDKVIKIVKKPSSASSCEQVKKKACKKNGPLPSIDSFSKGIIRNACLEMFKQNKTVTLGSLIIFLRENHDIEISKYCLWKTLHSIGFRYGKVGRNNMGHFERSDIVKKRIEYLRRIQEHRLKDKPIVYLDETWVDSNTYPSKQWLADGTAQRKLPAGRGQRFVILHCGSKEGFVENCSLVFESKANDGRDYHSEMNTNIFQRWTKEQLIPNLKTPSVIVMDNASYHSTQLAGTKAPISSTLKADMVKWLADHGTDVNPKWTKSKLYELIQSKKEHLSKTYEVDTLLQSYGHEVLRLPPYHCDLNPIELIWADVKRFVATNNSTFKKRDTKTLIEKAFASVSASKWESSCKHVIKIEKEYWSRDNIQPARVNPIIINLDDDSSDEGEDEDDSDMDVADDVTY